MNTLLLPRTPLGPFRVFETGTITRALEAGQWWDGHLKPILDEAEPGVAIDIGAHFGWFTIYLAGQHQQVIAVEPSPPAFHLLQWNIQRRPGLIPVIQCWPVAAYDRVEALEFAPGNDTTDAGAFGFTPAREGANMLTCVAGLPLDSYIYPTCRVTLIKCDAQGADLRALRGLRRTIERCRPLIVFEWEEGMAAWQGDRWQHYLDFFEECDYGLDRITTNYWDYVARPHGQS